MQDMCGRMHDLGWGREWGAGKGEHVYIQLKKMMYEIRKISIKVFYLKIQWIMPFKMPRQL